MFPKWGHEIRVFAYKVDFKAVKLDVVQALSLSVFVKRYSEMVNFISLLPFATVALGSFVVYDPADDIPSQDWALDNAYVFDWRSGGSTSVNQEIAITGPYYYSHQKGHISHQTLENHKNDTSVLVVTEGSTVTVDNTVIIKTGFSSSLNQASFYGKFFKD